MFHGLFLMAQALLLNRGGSARLLLLEEAVVLFAGTGGAVEKGNLNKE